MDSPGFLPGGWGPELVRPGITGYLAEPGDAHDLSNGILQLLEDEALRQAMGQQCRMIALKEYPLELQVQRYLELYRQVLANTCHDVPGSLPPFRQAVPEHIDGRRGLTSLGASLCTAEVTEIHIRPLIKSY